MGNDQPKKVGKINKSQIEIACLKARIHLELMRDRKSNEIIKGEKELVAKLNAKSRNKTEEALVMERVVNGLKYTQAVNQLIAYATSLKAQASFLAENVGNNEKLQPWLEPVHSMLYSADQLGLSSLNQFKQALKALNDPLLTSQFVNPEIVEMLSPTPTPYEMNIYVLQMSERNNIPLEAINAAGHQFVKDPLPSQRQSHDKSFDDIGKQLASQFQKNIFHGQGPNKGPQGFGDNGHGFGGSNQGFGGSNQGFSGNNQGFGGYGGNNGGGYGGQGYQAQNYPPPQNYQQPFTLNSQDVNPYKGLSSLHNGPEVFQASQIKPKGNLKPHQFNSYDNIGFDEHQNTLKPIYPSVDPNQYKGTQAYSPQVPPPQQNTATSTKSPTISQIMRDFNLK